MLVYEVKPRELDNVCLLAMELENRGYSVAVVNSWYALDHVIPEYDAKVVVIPACYEEGSYRFFAEHAARYEKVVNLQWEQIRYYLALEAKNQPRWSFSDIALETRHICWGKNTEERLQKDYSIPADCLKTTGYLSLDFYREELAGVYMSRKELFSKYGLKPHRKTAIFLSSFALASTPKNVLATFSDDYRLRMEHFYRSNQRAVVEWIDQALAKNTQIQFIYRPHPGEVCSENIVEIEKKYPNLFVIQEESVKQWLHNVDIIYNWNSTSLVEAYASNKKTFLLQPLPIEKPFTYPLFEGSTSICSLDEFIATLKQGRFKFGYHFPVSQEKMQEFYSIEKTPAYMRVCDYLVETYHSPGYTSRNFERPPRPIPLSAEEKTWQKSDIELYNEQMAMRNAATEQEIDEKIEFFRCCIKDYQNANTLRKFLRRFERKTMFNEG